MADEITHALLQTNGGQVASYLSGILHEALYDNTDLRMLGIYQPFSPNMGSDTMDVTIDAVPGASAAASSEISGGASNSAYTTGRYQHAVSRYLKKYQKTDLLGISGGPINTSRVLRRLGESVALTFTDLACAAFPNLANVVGTAGDQMDTDTVFDGLFQLNLSNVPDGMIAAVLHARQINQLKTSLRGETGAMQYDASTAAMLKQIGPGYKGSWAGVSFVQADSVTTVSSNHIGAMFGPGCYAWSFGPVGGIVAEIEADRIVAADEAAFIERVRDADNGMNSYILNFYPSWVEAEDLRGVRMRSIAS